MKRILNVCRNIFINETNKIPIQFIRFSIIGIVNTLIDIGVLNLLSILTGVYKGKYIFGLNTVSYFIATINSYFMNKYWTFSDKKLEKEGVKFSKFLLINSSGMLLNSSVVYFSTTHIKVGLSKELWMNISKILATFIVMCYNFVLYKFFVFKKN